MSLVWSKTTAEISNPKSVSPILVQSVLLFLVITLATQSHLDLCSLWSTSSKCHVVAGKKQNFSVDDLFYLVWLDFKQRETEPISFQLLGAREKYRNCCEKIQ